jgi:hypothetical protein
MGIFDFFGTIGSGWLSDRYDNRWLLFWYYGLRGLSLLFLPFSDFSFYGLSLFACSTASTGSPPCRRRSSSPPSASARKGRPRLRLDLHRPPAGRRHRRLWCGPAGHGHRGRRDGALAVLPAGLHRTHRLPALAAQPAAPHARRAQAALADVPRHSAHRPGGCRVDGGDQPVDRHRHGAHGPLRLGCAGRLRHRRPHRIPAGAAGLRVRRARWSRSSAPAWAPASARRALAGVLDRCGAGLRDDRDHRPAGRFVPGRLGRCLFRHRAGR